MTFDVIVFDWDGTLFDSMVFKEKNIESVFHKEFSFSKSEVQKWFRYFSGLPRKKVFRNILNKMEPSLEMTDVLFQNLSMKFTKANCRSAQKAEVFPEVVSVITKLKEQGHLLYISSSSNPSELIEIVNSKGIAHFFESIWGSEKNFNKGKEHFEKICKQQNCSRNNLLFIGDDENDVTLGREAQVKTIRIIREDVSKKGGADVQINSLSQLNNIIHSE
jgi:phosphoglycolate phosphatase